MHHSVLQIPERQGWERALQTPLWVMKLSGLSALWFTWLHTHLQETCQVRYMETLTQILQA